MVADVGQEYLPLKSNLTIHQAINGHNHLVQKKKLLISLFINAVPQQTCSSLLVSSDRDDSLSPILLVKQYFFSHQCSIISITPPSLSQAPMFTRRAPTDASISQNLWNVTIPLDIALFWLQCQLSSNK